MGTRHITRSKNCYCHTCKKYFHWLGIARHRAAHKERFEDCKITYTHGDVGQYEYSKLSDKLKETKHGTK